MAHITLSNKECAGAGAGWRALAQGQKARVGARRSQGQNARAGAGWRALAQTGAGWRRGRRRALACAPRINHTFREKVDATTLLR